MANLSLVFDILARDEASSTFRKVGDEAERTGNRAQSGLASIGTAAKAAGGLLLASGIIGAFTSLYDAAAESARIGRLTENVIRSTGGAAKISAQQVGDLAGAIAAKTGIDDEAIQSGENLLLTFTNIRNEAGAGNDIFNQTTQIMTDMSAALGTDASGSAIQLGKALNDPIRGVTALTRVGVSFTAQQKEQIAALVESGDLLGAQKIILGELTTEFGGAAAAAATPLDKLKVSVGNIAEAIGSYLIPVVGEFADKGLEAIEGISAGFSDGETDADGFKGAMQDLGIALHDVADVGGFLVGVVGDVVGFFKDLPGPVLLGVGAFTAFTLLKGPVSDAFETITLKALYAADAVGSATSGGLRGAVGNLVGFLGGPWGIAITAATIGLGFLSQGLGDSADVAEDAENAQQGFADAVREANGAINESVRQSAAKAAQDAGLLDIADKLGISTSEVTDAVLGNQDALTRVTSAANDYTDAALSADNAGDLGMTENAGLVNGFLDGLNVLAPTIQQTIHDQEQLAEATGETTAAQVAGIPTLDEITSAQEDLASAADDTKRAIDGINNALDELTGTNISTAQAEADLFQATQDASGALENMTGDVLDSAGSLNTQSTSGNAAMDVLYGVRDAGNELISTLAEQGATTAELTQRDAELRQSFIQSAEQMGISEDAANALADQILGIPSERLTTITANTDPARRAIEDLVNQQYNIIVGVTAPGSTARNVAVNDLASQYRRAEGGPIYGPGTGTSDSILMHASNGEYVIKTSSVDKYGIPFLDAVNAGYYKSGGLVAEDGSRVNSSFYDQLGPGIVRAEDGSLVRASSYYGANSLANFSVPVTANTAAAATGISEILAATSAAIAAQQSAGGSPGGAGGLGSGWQSIFNYVKARIPEARVNSSYRPGDPGYHGLGKAVDFGFGSGPGGNGSAGLASINRLLFDTVGGNLAELIYDGIGDDRSDLKKGRAHDYGKVTSGQHHNHVHAAVYDQGGLLAPGLTMAYNGTGQPERIRTAQQEASLSAPAQFTGNLYLSSGEFLGVVHGAMDAHDDALASDIHYGRG